MASPWTAYLSDANDDARRAIERAQDEFVSGNIADSHLFAVRSMVRDSWRRSIEHHVEAAGLPQIDLDSEHLEQLRREHPLADVMDLIRGLLLPGSAAESGVVVAVGDAAGRLLWVEGDYRLRDLTGEMGFVAGSNWAEHSVGTSAPGTALALGSSVQISGPEHFNRLVQPWSCTAAPVRDPETQRILGVIDITGGAEAVSSQAQLLVDATARAVESELLIARMRARLADPPRRQARAKPVTERTVLRVLGRDRALLETEGRPGDHAVTELSARHAELLLMLAIHRQGLSAERLSELVYGDPAATDTLRPEVVRLRRVLARSLPGVTLDSRPYRLSASLETDAHNVLSLLDRGAHRVALSAYPGEVLPDSVAPGVEEFRAMIGSTLREALMAEASVDVLLTYTETEMGAEDEAAMRLCLEMLPARSPRRTGLVARLERLSA